MPIVAAASLAVAWPLTTAFAQTGGTTTSGAACSNDTGITLPPGFCATVFADRLGHPVALNNDQMSA